MLLLWRTVMSVALCIGAAVSSDKKPRITASNRLSAGDDDNLTVLTESGAIRGEFIGPSGTRGGRLAAFLGVPYARPPIGALRFRPPQDAQPWPGVRQANAPPPSCFQRKDTFFGGDFAGAKRREPVQPSSEDCLYLNIYVPEVVSSNKEQPGDDQGDDNGLAVLVWLHGGGFSRGSAAAAGDTSAGWTSVDGRELAAEGGIIVVSVQYRLGSFGFLFLDADEDAPGNVATLDQAKALNWVSNNIFAFGGDPTRVTVGGEGAGGVSAALLGHATSLLALPPRRLILQSAGTQHPWSFLPPAESFRRSLRLAQLLGCPTQSKEEVVECLRSQSAAEIADKELGVVDRPGLGFEPFVPTIDGVVIVEEPRVQLRKEDGERLQILIGLNENEGSESLMRLLPDLFPNEDIFRPEMSSEQFDRAMDRIFDSSSTQLLHVAKFEYTNWTAADEGASRFAMVRKLAADLQVDCPVQEFIEAVERRADVFRYKFSIRDPLGSWPDWAGVNHGSELDFVFGRPLVQPDLYGDKEKIVSKFTMQAWTKFIKTGHPTGRGRGRSSVGWPRYSSTSPYLLHFAPDGNILVVTDDGRRKCAFWNDLAPKLRLEEDHCFGVSMHKVKKKFAPIKIKSPATTTTTRPPQTTATTVGAAATTTVTTFQPPPLYHFLSEEPINVLSRKSVLSADTSGFKVIESPDLPQPKSKRLSYQLSVLDRNPAQSGTSVWNLYRPEKPGNSPIYIAKGVFNLDQKADTNQAVAVRSEEPPLLLPPRRRRRPVVTTSKVYDPFNPSTYTRSLASQRRKADVNSPFYYPNYAPPA